MEDPEAIIPPTIQRHSTSEGKALADPPGWAVPVNHARHLEWWAYQESDHQQQHEPAIPIESSKIQNDPAIPPIPTSQPLHRYDDYVKANNNNTTEDDAFSWVPPPPVGAPNRSPDGWALTFRTLEAKRIFESAVPQRSWSVDSDKNEPVHGEQTVITDYTHNSWIMERPTQPSAESIAKETQSQTQEGYEEEIVVEEIIDEETATGTMEEEEVIDEEIIDEEFQDEEEIIDESSENDHDDLEEFINEEILEQVMSASESESHSCSTYSSKSLPQNPPTSNSQPATPSKPSSSSSFLPPKSSKEASKPSSSSSFLPPKSSKKAKTAAPKKVPNSTKGKKSTLPPRNRSQRAPDSVASSAHNGDSLPSRKKPISQSSSSSQTSSRKTKNKDESSSVGEITEDSGSTQIIYIRDPHDLEEIVQKCFNGNVRVEDEMTPTIDDDYFVPSKYQLALLTVLIIVVGMVIIVGLIVYFR